MFARRSVQLKPNKFAEFTKTFEKDILPLLRRQQGCEDEIALAAPDGIEVLAISLWDTRNHAETYGGEVYKEELKLLGRMIGSSSGSQNYRSSVSDSRRFPGRIIAFA
jgi:hypothetical protein